MQLDSVSKYIKMRINKLMGLCDKSCKNPNKIIEKMVSLGRSPAPSQSSTALQDLEFKIIHTFIAVSH